MVEHSTSEQKIKGSNPASLHTTPIEKGKEKDADMVSSIVVDYLTSDLDIEGLNPASCHSAQEVIGRGNDIIMVSSSMVVRHLTRVRKQS